MAPRQPPKTRFYLDIVTMLPPQKGRIVAMTGCTSGIGLVLAITAAAKGAQVLMLNRPSPRADQALQEVRAHGKASHVDCDLTSFASVRAAAARMQDMLSGQGLDILVNNAGLMGLPDQATADGFDMQMQVNHLSHFLLTHELWPQLTRAADLRGEARVVNHSSGARKSRRAERGTFRPEYLEPRGGHLGGDRWPGMGKWLRYQQSKLANLLFTYALQDHAAARPGTPVKALCAHPGPTDSGLQAKTPLAGPTTVLDRYILNSTLRIAQSCEDGTCGLARAAFDPAAEGGDFFGPDPEKRTGPAILLAPERDRPAEALLWQQSLEATGVRDFFDADARRYGAA